MKREKIILAVVAIATLLITLVGATFAWFSVRSNGSVNAHTDINTANLGTVTFANGNIAEAIGDNVYPGWSNDAIAFSVIGSNTTEPIEYTITASVTGSTTLGSALTYSMSCTSTNNGTCASTVNSAPLATTTYTGTLATGSDTHTYTVNMSLPETNTSQNDYQGLTYKVEFSVVLTNPATKYTASGSGREALYTISYNANGGTGTMNSSTGTISNNGFTSPNGKAFSVWNTQADGKGKTYYENEIVDSDVTLYAIWSSNISCFNYTIDGNNATITGYNYSSNCTKDVVIPSKIENKTVNIIGDNAFQSVDENVLYSLLLPNTIVSIGDYAFADNHIDELTLPNSVTSIGEYSFSGNTIKNLTLSENISVIPEEAFSYIQITELTIPASVTTIGDNAFYTIYELERVNFSNAGNLRTIGTTAFCNCSIENISFPEGITEIGFYAFNNINTLKNVYIPSSIISIKDGAFAGGGALENVCINKEDGNYYASESWNDSFNGWASGYSKANGLHFNCIQN